MTDPNETSTVLLVVGEKSAGWRRRLGPLAWSALEHLALAARSDSQWWAAAVGVRDIATGIGVAKDTAARAVTALAAAGVVTRESVNGPSGRRRSGYRLALPAGIELSDRPNHHDTPGREQDTGRCPNNEDSRACLANLGNAPSSAVARPATRPGHERHEGSGTTTGSPAAETQRSLFDPDTTTADHPTT